MVENAQKRELTLWRERGLGFVEQKEAVFEMMVEEGEKGLAMRLLVKGSTAVPSERAPDVLEMRREIEEGLSAEKEPGGGALTPAEVKRTSESVSVDVF